MMIGTLRQDGHLRNESRRSHEVTKLKLSADVVTIATPSV
jgi:hypothetical protein